MNEKMCVSERRTRIVEYLESVKFCTRQELCMQFGVSRETIRRDILYLSSVAPIYTKKGSKGGICILPTPHNKKYLTEKEEKCLIAVMRTSSNLQKEILCGILAKFSKKAIS